MAGPAGSRRALQAAARARPWRFALVIVALGLLGTCAARPGVLDQVRIAGELRVATRNSPTAYYLGANGPDGPEYELASRFAAVLGVPARFITLDTPAAVLAEVASGRAHIGAAGLAITPAWQRLVAFSIPYQQQRLHLIHRRDKPRPPGPDRLGGRSLELVAGSAHAAAVALLAPALRFRAVPGVDTLDLLDRVWSGDVDTTVADTDEFSLTRNFHRELRIAFNLPGVEQLAWALPRGDRELKARADAFLLAVRPDMPGLITRYYAPSDRSDYDTAPSLVRHFQDRMPALREFFETTAREFGEDWRVLAAIGYQESKWDAAAVSPTGVRGIMMLTAETAAALGVADRSDAAQSIRGGARYLRRMRDTIPERVSEPDRTWLALAAYNIGYGHLEDARILTQTFGRDPDSWQDVREFLPLLGQERWYTQLKRGYARGWEAARFVDHVRGYLDVIEWMSPDPATPPPGPDAAARTANTDAAL
ncbi:MAG TPA: membrane-bound lytic murein transglycosylase MltF [Steroidobacteraceae bacterium]|nr:membrane-bound lytic murein transglycosylase MltF [Steroidobacteraceae bacterium]